MAKEVSKSSGMCGCGNVCAKCWGVKLIVLGVLIWANAQYNWFGWAQFWAGILVIVGILKMFMPSCGHCK